MRGTETGKLPFGERVRKDFKKNSYLYLMLVPVVAYFGIFHYQPDVRAADRLQGLSPSGRGIWGSRWVGLEHIEGFFGSYYFVRLLRNTLFLSINDCPVGIPGAHHPGPADQRAQGQPLQADRAEHHLSPALHLPGGRGGDDQGLLLAERPGQHSRRSHSAGRPSTYSPRGSGSCRSTSGRTSGSTSAGAPSSTWRRSRPSTRSSTRRPGSTGPAGCGRS